MTDCEYYDCMESATHILKFEPIDSIGPTFQNKLCKHHAELVAKGFKGK